MVPGSSSEPQVLHRRISCVILIRVLAVLATVASPLDPMVATADYSFNPDILLSAEEPGTVGHSTISAGQRSVAAYGDSVYVVWTGAVSDSTTGPFFVRSIAGGKRFDQPIRLCDEQRNTEFPSVTVAEDGTIYVAWYDALGQAYLDRSIDGGVSFGTDLRVDDTVPPCYVASSPSLAVSPHLGYVYLAYPVYCYGEEFTTEVRLARSLDGGETFQPSVRVDDLLPGQYLSTARVAVGHDGAVYVFWIRVINVPTLFKAS